MSAPAAGHSAAPQAIASSGALPRERIERVDAWGMSQHAVSYVYRPSTVEGARAVHDLARSAALPVGLRGAGCSYGDAALISEGIALDLSRMNRILEWNPDTGLVRAEAGVTIGQLWRHVIGDGWWPPVVPGTMHPTLGGALGMNIHGKNNYQAGTLGEHVVNVDLLLPDGALRRCSHEQDADLFHAVIGGFGVLGCLVSIALQMKRVYSGLLRVEPVVVPRLHDFFEEFEHRLAAADYLVGWVDCFARGNALGRGQIHHAGYLPAGEDPCPTQTLRAEHQDLPGMLYGVVPRSMVPLLMKPMVRPSGVRLVNWAKYRSSVRRDRCVHYEPHARFAFLLDYVPEWKRAYGPRGLVQYQSFIPKAAAEEAFRGQIALTQARGLVPYLGVLKRHRPDPFLMTHSVDGYSLALDFHVTRRNLGRLRALTADLDRIVMEAGGRHYLAKDSLMSEAAAAALRSEERTRRFLDLKRQIDPEGLLQTDLYRRLFAT
ncbi:MAG TPA: FAD-binding oxidoreductase [Chthonomonadales bacterium]|nr:FAD-binding oxidoreductase [Chthonomonadales bacterium]